jgi:hypothetical protein
MIFIAYPLCAHDIVPVRAPLNTISFDLGCEIAHWFIGMAIARLAAEVRK